MDERDKAAIDGLFAKLGEVDRQQPQRDAENRPQNSRRDRQFHRPGNPFQNHPAHGAPL